jgi:hypothetical protein
MKKPPIRWLFCVWGRRGKWGNRKWRNGMGKVESPAADRSWSFFLLRTTRKDSRVSVGKNKKGNGMRKSLRLRSSRNFSLLACGRRSASVYLQYGNK